MTSEEVQVAVRGAQVLGQCIAQGFEHDSLAVQLVAHDLVSIAEELRVTQRVADAAIKQVEVLKQEAKGLRAEVAQLKAIIAAVPQEA